MATSYLGLEFNFMPVEWHCALGLYSDRPGHRRFQTKWHDINLAASKGGAVPNGFPQSAGQAQLAGLGKQPAPGHNRFTQLRWWEKLWPVISSMPMVIIALQCAFWRLTKTPSTEGAVAHISSKLHNYAYRSAANVQDTSQEG